jgi:SAM-dependent methyltransferase
VVRWAPRVTGGPVLDVACGGGRHARFFRDLGFDVVAVDRERTELEGIRFVKADLEDGNVWPFGEEERFGAIVVTNYLHRPLFPHLAASLDVGGVLIYETFMAGNERLGRPSNPHFLLRPGELREAFATLEELGFEEGEVERPKRAMIQRICALKR